MINYIQQRRVAAMRRSPVDRMCLCTSVVLIVYIVWNILPAVERRPVLDSDPRERNAHAQAVKIASPMAQNTALCSGRAIDLLLVVMSNSANFLQRQAVRETWGSVPDMFGTRSQHLFVLGYYPNGNFYKDLVSEAEHEKDLLYLTVNDHDETRKEIHGYQWLERYCPNATYLFKTEDDLFVNTYLLHELIRELKTEPAEATNRFLYSARLDPLFDVMRNDNGRAFLFGLAYLPGLPERNLTASPYFVTREEYPYDLYPRYCSGFGYLMNSATRSVLIREALKDERPFRFAAVYLTGIIPQRLNFVCELFHFTLYQGPVHHCIGMIKNATLKSPAILPPLACSTGLHLGQNSFVHYYELWTELKTLYADRIKELKAV